MVVLVTNNHVFQTLKQARSASYQFGYQSDSEKWQPKKIPGEELIVDNKSFFFTHHVCVSKNMYDTGYITCMSQYDKGCLRF